MIRFFLFLNFASLLCAQPRPVVSARRILTEVEDNYCSCNGKNLRIEADVTVQKTSQGFDQRSDYKVTTSFLSPAKYRIERKHPDGNWFIELNNTKEMAQFGPQNYHYRAKAPQIWSESSRPDEFPGSHFLLYDSILGNATNVRLAGEESLMVEGKRIVCDVVEVTRNLKHRQGTITGRSKFWVGKERRLVFKEVSTRGPMPFGDPGDGRIDTHTSTRTVVVTKIEEDAALAEDIFEPDVVAKNLPSDEPAAPAGVIATGPAPSSTRPMDARPLLVSTSLNYLSMQTYGAEMLVAYDGVAQGFTRRQKFPLRVSYRRPGKWRIFLGHEDALWFQDAAISDGYWEYWPKRNLYWRNPYTQFLRGPDLLFEDLLDSLVSARQLPDQSIEADGRTINCAVVEARFENGLEVIQGTTRFSGAQAMTLWIDRQRNLVLQWRTGSYTETIVKIEVNPSLPDSEFQFTPPTGARKKPPDY